MTKEEIEELFRFLKASYPSYEFNSDMISYWANELSQYSFEDIKAKLKYLMANDKYANRPPQLEVILSRLPKIKQKIDFTKITYFCKICRRPFNSIDECHSHEDRCSAIRYIESKSKKYNWDFNNQIKAELYQYSEENFENFYNNFLQSVYKKTNNEWERNLIKNIFNPPNKEEALKFLQN